MPLLWLLLTAVLVGVGLGGWWAYCASQRRDALRLAADGRFDEAAPLLERCLAGSPEDVAVLSALARGHAGAKDHAAALPHLNAWCRARPADREPHRLRLEAHRELKQFSDALADGLVLLRLDPDDEQLLLSVAGLAFSAGDFEQAETLCRRVLEQSPNRRDARRLLAQSLRASGRTAAAAEVYDGLLKENPNDPAAMLGRAGLALTMGDVERGIQLLEAVRARDPLRKRTVLSQLAVAYGRAGRAADAREAQRELHALQEVEVLQDALRSQPGDPDLQARTARALIASGQTDQGLKLLAATLVKLPDHSATHSALADYYEAAGEKGLAAKHRRKATPAPPRGEPR